MKHFYFILLLSSVGMNAQYYKAKLLMADGSVKEGQAELPSNQLLDGKVAFKGSSKKVEKIEEDSIQKILYTTGKGTQFLFERSTIVHLYRSFRKEVEVEKKQKHWILLFHQNSALNVYMLAQRYKIDKKGTMISITGGPFSMWEFVYFLYRRNEEDKAYIVSGKGFSNEMVRDAMETYFKDAPALVERIKGKEFRKEGFPVETIADAYVEYYKEGDKEDKEEGKD